MPLRPLSVVSFVFAVWTTSFADPLGGRLTPALPAMSDADKNMIGRAVCGEGGFETTEAGLRCKVCPEFTGNAGSDEGLVIGRGIGGRFTAADSVGEWVLDTDGCEAHFESFGGAILLGPADGNSPPASPAVAPGSASTAKPAAGPLEVAFYRPGFRLDDCLAFSDDNARTLLVCSEADTAQGEVIGHISAMEISRRGITRWRLLRWYDNSGSDMEEVVSITPVGMSGVELDGGRPALQIKMDILESTRVAYEKDPEPSGKSVDLVFRRQGQRFFATDITQAHLDMIGSLTRKMLE